MHGCMHDTHLRTAVRVHHEAAAIAQGILQRFPCTAAVGACAHRLQCKHAPRPYTLEHCSVIGQSWCATPGCRTLPLPTFGACRAQPERAKDPPELLNLPNRRTS
eukprot:257285-Chlamydomonas_euryale.AAC.2